MTDEIGISHMTSSYPTASQFQLCVIYPYFPVLRHTLLLLLKRPAFLAFTLNSLGQLPKSIRTSSFLLIFGALVKVKFYAKQIVAAFAVLFNGSLPARLLNYIYVRVSVFIL